MKLRALVLAAGKGTRMRSPVPKVLHPLSGRTVIEHVLEELTRSGFRDQWVVAGFGRRLLRDTLGPRFSFVHQTPQLGTGHAVLAAERAFKSYRGELLVLAGDVPAIRGEMLRRLVRLHAKNRNACSCLSMTLEDPAAYGRIVRDETGNFRSIREALEASSGERLIREVNTGIYVFHYPKLRGVLGRLKPSGKKKELYLTDAVELLLNRGERVAAYPLGSLDETQGINRQADLSMLEEKMNKSNIAALQSHGVTVIMPSQTYVQEGVRVGSGTVIHPFVWIERGAVIGRRCEIGPFAKIRAGCRIGDGAVIGSFVEIVRTRVGAGTRLKHLSYFGDAEIGRGVNVGAGTITANYDGRKKQRTRIGDRVFLGVNTSLIAPVLLGRGVKTGAGAVVTARQKIKEGSVLVGVPAQALKKRKS